MRKIQKYRVIIVNFSGYLWAGGEKLKQIEPSAFPLFLLHGFKKLVPEARPRMSLSGGFNRGSVAVFGPAPAFFSKLKGKYRWQMLLKGKNVKPLHEFIASLLKELEKRPDKVKLVVDIDPATTT